MVCPIVPNLSLFIVDCELSVLQNLSVVAMRLLDTETGQFVEKDPEHTKYAILSHTWDTKQGEQTYEQLKKIQKRYDPGSRLAQSGYIVAEADGTFSFKVVKGQSLYSFQLSNDS